MSLTILDSTEVSSFNGLRTVNRADAVANCLRQFNVDAGETGMFLRQQEQILAAPFMTEYPEVRFRQILKVSNEISNGATEWTYRQFDEMGKASIISDMAADFPSVDVQGAEKTQKILSLGTSYHYSMQEVRTAAFGGMPLETMRAQVARRVVERLFDKLVAVGDAKFGFTTGYVNDANLLSFTKTSQAIGTTWQDSNGVQQATPAEVLQDIHGACDKIVQTTKGVHQPNELLVGLKGYSFLASKPQSPQFTDASLMSYILRMSPWIKSIKYWPQLDTAGSGSKERIIVHEGGNPDIARVMIPQEFEQFPPLPVNLAFKVLCHARYAGVAVFRPSAICYVDGTQP